VVDWEIRRSVLEDDPHVAVITIDRPPVNAMTGELYAALGDLFVALGEEPDLRCVILTGAGTKAFVAGADVRNFIEAKDSLPERQRQAARAFAAIRGCRVPVIGAINGPALGAGLVIASVTDIMVAAESATFGLPEIDVGVLGGSRFLEELVPPQRLRRMTLTGYRMPAADLMALGGLEAVVPVDSVVDAAAEIAREISGKSPIGVRYAKEALDLLHGTDLERGYRIEQLFTEILSAHPDSKEAASAWLEKRSPVFSS
jgi:enoyl-CoA hydratase